MTSDPFITRRRAIEILTANAEVAAGVMLDCTDEVFACFAAAMAFFGVDHEELKRGSDDIRVTILEAQAEGER